MRKKSKSKWNWANKAGLSLTIALVCAGLADAQQLEGQFRMNGKEVRKAFEPIRDVIQKCSAVIYEGRKSIGYGAVVSPDGYIVTKASELEREGNGPLSIRIDRTTYDSFNVVSIDHDWDVALLKIEAEGLVPVDWNDGDEPTHGTWVVSNGATTRLSRRIMVGIISANAREVKGATNAVLGVMLTGDEDKIVIGEVQDETGAAEAGLKEGDILLSAEDKELKSREELLELLAEKAPGDFLKLRIKRGEEELELDVKLMARHKAFSGPGSRNDQMSGRFSKRRTNFGRILQHDINLNDRTNGGPLLNLEGRCVGINIARASRSETYAIPASEMQDLLAEMMATAGTNTP